MIERWRRFYRAPDDDCVAALLDAVHGATASVHVLAYGFTLLRLAALLVEKRQAGLEVGVVADHTQSTGRAQRAVLQGLLDGGVPVTVASSPSGALNHEKAILIDEALGPLHNKSCAVYGSFNFSQSAQAQENFLVVDNDPSICSYLEGQYNEALAVGKAHPAWQLSPTMVTDTTTIQAKKGENAWPATSAIEATGSAPSTPES